MSYYRTCPYCRANLDPGEPCDCQKKRAAPDATNIESGKVKVIDQTTFTSILHETKEDCQV